MRSPQALFTPITNPKPCHWGHTSRSASPRPASASLERSPLASSTQTHKHTHTSPSFLSLAPSFSLRERGHASDLANSELTQSVDVHHTLADYIWRGCLICTRRLNRRAGKWQTRRPRESSETGIRRKTRAALPRMRTRRATKGGGGVRELLSSLPLTIGVIGDGSVASRSVSSRERSQRRERERESERERECVCVRATVARRTQKKGGNNGPQLPGVRQGWAWIYI